MSGIDTSRTRQLGRSDWQDGDTRGGRKSDALKLSEANKSVSASRTRKSSSTTKTMDFRATPPSHDIGKVNATIVPRGALSLAHSSPSWA